MNASLTILLPVHNAQERLAEQVERLLELLPDMTRQFEIVIVDDGSTDDTGYIADELSLFFPQISLVRHEIRRGLDAAIQSGLDASTGEVVLVGDEQIGIRSEDLLDLWQIHSRDEQTVARRADAGAPVTWLSRVLARSQQRRSAAPRPLVQMARRRETTPASNATAKTSTGSANLRVDASAGSAAGGAPVSGGPKRPANRVYLDRLRKFALGE